MKLRAAVMSLATLAAAAPTYAADPPVPIGQDPGGTAIAIISTGIDYTIPEIAKGLARDGEGEIIAWDFVDDDSRPFEPSKVLEFVKQNPGTDFAYHVFDQTTLAGRLTMDGHRLIVTRVAREEPLSMAKAVSFIARTHARIIVVSTNETKPDHWVNLRRAAEHFTELRFIIWGGPINWGLPNVEDSDSCDPRLPEPLEEYARICALLRQFQPIKP